MPKKLFTAAVAAALALAPVACNKSEPGGPGAPAGGNKDDTFQLVLPTIPNAIKQGDTESVKVGIDRGKAFKQTVKLDAKAPDKISVEFDRTSVKDGESQEVTLKIKPAADAPDGTHKITISGTPEQGPAASKELSVIVRK